MGYIAAEVICGNANVAIPDATLAHFGVLISLMHNAWVRHVAGRLESRYRYSARIVYNNFPWPSAPTEKQTADLEAAAGRARRPRCRIQVRCRHDARHAP